MVTLKAQKADSIFGSQGATKTYVKSKINAIPASTPATPGGSDGDIQVNDSGDFGALSDGTNYRYARFTGASALTGTTSFSETSHYTNDKVSVGLYNCIAGRINTVNSTNPGVSPGDMHDMGNAAQRTDSIAPHQVWKVNESISTAGNHVLSIILPITSDFDAQAGFTFFAHLRAYVSHTADVAYIQVYSVVDGGRPTELINGADYTSILSAGYRLITATTGGNIVNNSWMFTYTADSDIGWSVHSMSPSVPHSH